MAATETDDRDHYYTVVTNMQDSNNAETESSFFWSPRSVKLMLALYGAKKKDFEDGKFLKKEIWNSIGAEMNNHGFKVGGSECDKKFRNMKKTFMSIVQRKDGNSSRRAHQWEYFNIMEKLVDISDNDAPQLAQTTICVTNTSQSPEPTAMSLLDSIENNTVIIPTHLQNASGDEFIEIQPEVSPANVKKRKLANNSPPAWFKMYVQKKMKKEDERLLLMKQLFDEQKKMNELLLEATKQRNDILRNLQNTLERFISEN